MPVQRFLINTPDATIHDLSERLARSRFTTATGQPWKAGTDPEYLRLLVHYWLAGFDWRAREQKLNSFPNFITNLNGRQVHFIHVRAVPSDPPPMPLVLTHGWPSCFLEFLPLARRLTDPESYGSDANDTFDIVIPSLPGFAFSDLPSDGIVTPPRIADLWKGLMTDVLGYQQFGAYGGDLGSHVTDFLGALHPDHVLGVYTHHPRLSPDLSKGPPPTPAEKAYLANRAAVSKDGQAYAAIQGTRPDTLAAGLIDSPVGLAAWIIEK
ncbi:MAG: epoxide hydrolase, partial [Verrucomicrobia bacterium]|nr:epoxide hydrolase [Verrucomicrobiota bacterium]